MIKLSDIRIDGGTQFRDQIDQDVVKEYKEAMLNGAEFPPIQTAFDGSNYWLWDGFHRYFAFMAMGLKQVDVDYKPGTQEDAQDWALSANAKHGQNRNNATKRKQVEAALSMERHKDKSDREIAKLCEVSVSFVGATRRPEVKERQAKSVAKHYKNKSNDESVVELHPDDKLTDPKPSMTEDFAPSEDELEANQLKMQADMDLAIKIIEADDILATLHAEVKRLSDDNASLQSRVNALMREKNKAIDLLQKAQRELDRIKKAKK
jgi:hypothetical protein